MILNGTKRIFRGITEIKKIYKLNNIIWYSLPSGYKKLEYIEATGTQYIESGVLTDKENVKYDGELLFTNTEKKQYFGANYGYYFGIDEKGRYTLPYYTDLIPSGDFDRICFEYSKESNICKLTVNGKSAKFQRTSAQKNAEIFVFAMIGFLNNTCNAKLKYWKIYKEDKLVRYFIPCINNTGDVGLYDLMGELFYGNNGTGFFLAGGEII